MLPLELLRTKISREKIQPMFCTLEPQNPDEYELAKTLIGYFQSCCKDNTSKGNLMEKNNSLETKYDYKLVRGLFVLLERRSVFENKFTKIKPAKIRKELFEESARRGLGLEDSQRQDIIDFVAEKNSISSNDVESAMWGDREDNLILTRFDSISVNDLLLWYNLSLAQTLLFRCISLEFYVEGGLYWKEILRNVKRFGLMYSLQLQNPRDSDSITCTLEGPMSLFKMTDRYGTSIAKLLQWIIRAPTWRISGSIVKKNDDGKKIYQFEMSHKIADGIFQSPSAVENSDGSLATNTSQDEFNYDSSLELKFEKMFRQYFDKNDDWAISREPNPIVADGKAMIPDFLFERFGRRVYFEIVGFWTHDYLERKAAKIKAIFRDSQNRKDGIDLLVGVNSELACSQLNSISHENVFTFKKEVPIKPILEHLKKIDKEIIQEKTRVTKIQLDTEIDIVSIQTIAQKHNIPAETVLKILCADYPELIVVGNTHMLSKSKINKIKNSLGGITKFVEACMIFDENKIPESCHADLTSKLGYDVVWNDLDPNNATLSEKNT